MSLPIILASASPERFKLLERMYITPNNVIVTDIDESALKAEMPNRLALRLAIEKCQEAIKRIDYDCYIITADTVVARGRRILPKATTDNEVMSCLNILSGVRHKVFTGVCVTKKEKDIIISKNILAETIVKFKQFSKQDIELYIKSKEGINKAGGYAIMGLMEAFIVKVMGCYSTVAGIPMRETLNLLSSLGFKQFNI